MNDTPKTSEAAGTPSNNWEATAERLFECSAKLERENARFRAALEEIAECHDSPHNDQIARDALANNPDLPTR